MGRARRPSSQTLALLRALAQDPSAWRYGYELRSGSLYPILVRLSDRGLLEARWETEPASGRPPRHLYRLTPPGLEYASLHAKPRVEAPRAAGPLVLWGAS
jgi:PadR family transcriptional regulator, regulatory protein PadR